MSRARVSQHGAEVWYAPSGRAIVSQAGIEVWYDWTAASPTTITGVGVSQHGAEVWYAPSGRAIVSQAGIEVWYVPSADDTEGAPAPTSGVRVFGFAG